MRADELSDQQAKLASLKQQGGWAYKSGAIRYTEAEIRQHLMPNLCRCGTQVRILRAVRRAAQVMQAADTLGRSGKS